MSDNIRQSIYDELSNCDINFYDYCYKFIKKIKEMKSSDKLEWLICLFETYGFIDEECEDKDVKDSEFFNKSQIGYYCNLSREFIGGLIDISTKKAHKANMKSIQFYNEIWDTIENSYLLNSDEELAGALLNLLNNKLIPYYETGNGLTIDQGDFSDYMKKSQLIYSKIKYIYNLDFQQKTQSASLILDEIFKIDNYNEQVVALVVLLNIIAKPED